MKTQTTKQFISKDDLQALGNAIQQHRTKRNLTQDDLATSINSHREHISRIERGLVDVRFSTMIRISKELRLKEGELFKYSNPED